MLAAYETGEYSYQQIGAHFKASVYNCGADRPRSRQATKMSDATMLGLTPAHPALRVSMSQLANLFSQCSLLTDLLIPGTGDLAVDILQDHQLMRISQQQRTSIPLTR